MSGGGLSDSRPGIILDSAQVANKRMMDHFGKTTLEDMRALSFEEMREMSAEYTAETNNRVMWSPVIDNYMLTGTFSDIARADEIADVPYMIGFTANDMNDMTQAVRISVYSDLKKAVIRPMLICSQELFLVMKPELSIPPISGMYFMPSDIAGVLSIPVMRN